MLEVLSDCVRMNIDVVLMQEPYSIRGTVPVVEFGRVFYVALPRHNRYIDVWTCVIILNERVGAVMLSEFSSPYCIAVDLVLEGNRLVVCSNYIRPGRRHDIECESLERVSAAYATLPLLIASDINCSSPLWFGLGVGCQRSRRIEDLVAFQQLSVLNEWDERSTFETVNGRSNVDITLCNDLCYRMNISWTLGELYVDHRSIMISVGEDVEAANGPLRERFVLSGANWVLFDGILQENLVDIDEESVDTMAAGLTNAVMNAARAAIPIHQSRKRVPWWSRQLSDLRKSVKRARRRFQRARGERRIHLQEVWRNLRREYVYTVSQCKWIAWREWITREGARNPWGIVYKNVIRQCVRNRVLVTVRREGRVTTGVNETLSAFLGVLLPGDDPGADVGQQAEIRRNFDLDIGCGPCVGEWNNEDLGAAILKMKLGTAPGLDDVSPDLVFRSWGRVSDICLRLFNRCLTSGVYPTDWKLGEVILIPKSGDRDLSLIKSFRPITLLSVWGKLLERLIETSLKQAIYTAGGLSNRQYGFRKGKGTVDAIRHVIRWVEGQKCRFILAVFLDIRGAFDSAWWPAIMRQLIHFRCPLDVVRLIRAYLTGRAVRMNCGSAFVEQMMERGCPQGSVLAPFFWNLLLNEWLCMDLGINVECIAYADDLVLLSAGNRREDVEVNTSRILDRLYEWGVSVKLDFALEKCACMSMRGLNSLERRRNVRMNGEIIRYVKECVYLGVTIKENLKMEGNVDRLSERVPCVFSKCGVVARRDWGYKGSALRVLYKGVVESMCSYGCEVWATGLRVRALNKLNSLQRKCLKIVARAYKTASSASLCVIVGVLPLNILFQMRIRERELRTEGIRLDVAKDVAVDEALDTWQQEWGNGAFGRQTFAFFPDVRQRSRVKFYDWTHYSVQYLTGHGNFAGILYRWGRRDSPLCPECNVEETSTHVMFDCVRYEVARTNFRLKYEQRGCQFVPHCMVCNVDACRVFVQFCERLGRMREDYVGI